MRDTTTSEARRRMVRRLLTTRRIRSQSELRDLLAVAGYRVTQATVSRDLGAVGARKVRDPDDGEGRYELAEEVDQANELDALRQAIDEYVATVRVSGNLVVIKVPPGAAHLVASRMDAVGLSGVLGTVAGDDTLLVVADEEIGGAAVAAMIERGVRP